MALSRILRPLTLLLGLLLILAAIYLASAYATLRPSAYSGEYLTEISRSVYLSPNHRSTSDELVARGELKLLTFNAGLLDLRIHTRDVLKPTDYLAERLARLPAALIGSQAHIIALQEVYDTQHIDYLIRELNDEYPYVFLKHISAIKLNNGLLLFSKFPLINARGEAFENNMPWDEWLVADRGLQSAEIEFHGKRIGIVNLHATSGGTSYDYEDPYVQSIRQDQIQQAINAAGAAGTDLQILLGDFNTGPNSAKSNYDFMIDNRFLDAQLSFDPQANDYSRATWDGANPLNGLRGYDGSSYGRIDLIFLSQALAKQTHVIDAQRVMDDFSVLVDADLMVPLSDHYGVEIILQFMK